MATYDFIIVGGGSAGCVLANRLSANPDTSVLLLEAGPSDNSPLIRAPLGTVLLYDSFKFNWKFWTEKEPYLNDRGVFCPQGKTLGGSSAINAMLYIRGNARDYDHWEALGNTGWGYQALLKYFRMCESNENFHNEYHGIDGPLNVKNIENPHPHAERLVLAALQAGYQYNADFNGKSQEGFGLYQVTMKGLARNSAAQAFLDPIKHRNNLTVVTNALVSKINFDEDKAVGITYSVNNIAVTVSAKKEVIVCAGSFNSPKLLMLSGVGPRQELEQLGIAVIKDLPGVGKNLQEHVDIVIATQSKIADTVAFTLGGALEMFYSFVRHLLGKPGLISKPLIEAGGFLKSSPDKEIPDIQLQSMCSLFNDHGFDAKIIRNHGYSVHVTLLRPKSRGRVTLKSANHMDAPSIQLNLLNDDDDVKDLSNGLKLAREILSQDAYQRHYYKELYPGEHIRTDEDIIKMLREKACHIYHPVGTCKMGNDNLAVVDDQLRVHGLKNLRVIDASIMPTIISGNTNATVLAIASKGADMILHQHNKPSAD